MRRNVRPDVLTFEKPEYVSIRQSFDESKFRAERAAFGAAHECAVCKPIIEPVEQSVERSEF